MRIGLLTSVGRTIDAFFTDAVDVWQADGHEVHCAAGTAPAAPVPFDLIEGLTQKPSTANVGVATRLVAWARDRRLDVVVTNTATASTLVRLRRMPCKLTYFCHGLHWNHGWHPARVIEEVLARRCDSVITINSDDYAWFSRRHGRVLRLREGVGVPPTYAWSPLPSETTTRLAWAGDFVPRKRPQLAIEVMAHLQREGHPAHLSMLGDGELLEATMRSAEAIGVAGAVTFVGRTDVRPTIAASHALLHTASWEGLPRILLEGLAMGRRAFAFDVKGVRDVPEAILARDGDPAALATALIRRPPLQAIDAAVAESFRSDAVARTVLRHLEDVVG